MEQTKRRFAILFPDQTAAATASAAATAAAAAQRRRAAPHQQKKALRVLHVNLVGVFFRVLDVVEILGLVDVFFDVLDVFGHFWTAHGGAGKSTKGQKCREAPFEETMELAVGGRQPDPPIYLRALRPEALRPRRPQRPTDERTNERTNGENYHTRKSTVRLRYFWGLSGQR